MAFLTITICQLIKKHTVTYSFSIYFVFTFYHSCCLLLQNNSTKAKNDANRYTVHSTLQNFGIGYIKPEETAFYSPFLLMTQSVVFDFESDDTRHMEAIFEASTNHSI